MEVSLVNSNPATIMTDHTLAHHVYLRPLKEKSIAEVLEKQKIDAVLPTMGGQTSLNLAMACEREGLWKKHGVRIIGVDAESIRVTEDREVFRLRMEALGIPTCKGATASSLLQAKEIAQSIGFPLIIRPSYTLGGFGGGGGENARCPASGHPCGVTCFAHPRNTHRRGHHGLEGI